MNNQDENASFRVAQNGQLNVMRVLLEAGADCNEKNHNGETPLHVAGLMALTYDSTDEVKLLLQHGADIESLNNQNETALFGAARNGRLRMMRILLKAGAVCNKKNIHGERLLHFAALFYDRPKVVSLLLQYGADIGAMHCNHNETALFSAAQYGRLNIVKTLLEAVADRGKKSASSRTPSDVVKPKRGDHEMKNLLRVD